MIIRCSRGPSPSHPARDLRQTVASDISEFMRQNLSEAVIVVHGVRGSQVRDACLEHIALTGLPVSAELSLGRVRLKRIAASAPAPARHMRGIA